VNIKILKKYNTFFLLVLIVGLSVLLRFYRLDDIYVFTIDEEYQATYSWTLVKDPHPIWIGLPAAAVAFYLGPYFTYFTAILLALSKGDQMITAYFAAFIGVITTFVIFFVGKNVFNLTTGVVTSLLYATLPLFVFYDQKYWNTMFSNLIILLLFLTLILIRSSKWWWLLYAGLAGAIFETHLPPIPLLLIGVWYFLKGKYWKDIKLLLLCSVIFLLFYWPLIVFDFNHNFSNLKVFTRLSGQDNQSKISFNPVAKLATLFDSMGRFWYLKSGSPNADEINFGCSSLSLSNGYEIINRYTNRTYASIWLSLVSLIMFLYFLLKSLRDRNSSKKLLAIFLLIAACFFIIYQGGSYEYYSLGFLMLFTFVPGILISSFKKNYQLVALALVILVSAIGINTVLHTSDEFGLGPKKILIKKVMNILGENSFSIEGRGICHDYEGWRYLFKVYGRVPAQSYTDKNLGWLYPEEISKEPPKYTVILSEDRIPLKEDLSGNISIKEGGYRAYIIKNR